MVITGWETRTGKARCGKGLKEGGIVGGKLQSLRRVANAKTEQEGQARVDKRGRYCRLTEQGE